MATVLFGPYRPMTIEQMKTLAAKISKLTPSECRKILAMLDRAAAARPFQEQPQ